jgi:hypothetical protein
MGWTAILLLISILRERGAHSYWSQASFALAAKIPDFQRAKGQTTDQVLAAGNYLLQIVDEITRLMNLSLTSDQSDVDRPTLVAWFHRGLLAFTALLQCMDESKLQPDEAARGVVSG